MVIFQSYFKLPEGNLKIEMVSGMKTWDAMFIFNIPILCPPTLCCHPLLHHAFGGCLKVWIILERVCVEKWRLHMGIYSGL